MLIAEDDAKQSELLRRYAVADGHEVVVVADGRAAVEEIRRRKPDLLVLDVMMPRLNGLDVCRFVRTTRGMEDISILIVTGRAGESDLVDGLDIGADDYVGKPFSPRELMARIRALLRRGGRGADDQREVRVGDLVVDTRTRMVWWGDARIEVTPGEFRLLSAMASEPGRVFTRDRLLEHLHGLDPYSSPRTVDVHIANLRKKITPTMFRTVYGVGYSIPEPE